MSLVDAIDSSDPSLDTEQLLVRSLQIPAASLFPPVFTPIAKGLADTPSSISSIEQAKSQTVPLFRPKLQEPQQNPLIGVIDAHFRTEKLAQRQTALFSLGAKELQTCVEELDREKTEAIEKHAKANETRDTWSVFSTVIRYIGSAATIVLASTVGITTGPGALLLAAGGLGLINNILQDTQSWNAIAGWFTKSQELQLAIAQKIEVGMLLLSLGLGLAGGVLAYQSGALSAAAQGSDYKKISEVLGIAAGVMGATSRVGIALADKRIADLQARLKELEMEITTNHQTQLQDAKLMESLLNTLQSMTENTSKSIRSIDVQSD